MLVLFSHLPFQKAFDSGNHMVYFCSFFKTEFALFQDFKPELGRRWKKGARRVMVINLKNHIVSLHQRQ